MSKKKGIVMQKNSYRKAESITNRVLAQLKTLKFDSKSVLLGMTAATLASAVVPSGPLASFGQSETYKAAIKEAAPESMRTSANFFAARYGLLPDSFNEWGMVDESGWSVAHEAALYGHLPEGFEHMDLADRKGMTVADAKAQGERNAIAFGGVAGAPKVALR